MYAEKLFDAINLAFTHRALRFALKRVFYWTSKSAILVEKGVFFSTRILEKGVFFKVGYELGIRFGRGGGGGGGGGDIGLSPSKHKKYVSMNRQYRFGA